MRLPLAGRSKWGDCIPRADWRLEEICELFVASGARGGLPHPRFEFDGRYDKWNIFGLSAYRNETPGKSRSLVSTSINNCFGNCRCRYIPLCGREHIASPQQLFPSLLDIIGHFPAAQQVIFPAESFDIMEQVLPPLPWQQLSPLQHEPDLLSHFESLPQQVVFPSVESWLQQAQALALLLSVDALGCDVL